MAGQRKLSMAAVEAICARIVGGEGLQDALEYCGWKSRTAFLTFIAKNEKARELYTLAREMRAEFWAEEIIGIADDASDDYHDVSDGGGGTRLAFNPESVARSRLRVDTRKWVCGKHLPKTYGDKVDVNHGGGITLNVITGINREPGD